MDPIDLFWNPPVFRLGANVFNSKSSHADYTSLAIKNIRTRNKKEKNVKGKKALVNRG